jgi:5-methylcytosine-specific restriction endonuclease McrA
VTGETLRSEAQAATRRHNLRANHRYGSPVYKVNRVKALERDGHRCRVCRSTENVQAHHRTPIWLAERYGWTEQETHAVANLITLCDKHNKEADAAQRPKVKRELQAHPGIVTS